MKLKDLKPGTFYVVIEEGLAFVHQMVEQDEEGNLKSIYYDIPNQRTEEENLLWIYGEFEVYPLNNQNL